MLEESLKKDLRRSKIKRIVLSVIAMAGIMTLAAVAPGVVEGFYKLTKKRYRSHRQYYANKIVMDLVDQGLVTIENKSGRKFVRLTRKGVTYLQDFEKRDFKVKKPSSWDGKWRIVIFDVPEYRKKDRDQIRMTLKRIGFQLVQKSVWAYPYNCEEYIQLLKADFRIGKDVLYIISEKIENDWWLKKKFGLT